MVRKSGMYSDERRHHHGHHRSSDEQRSSSNRRGSSAGGRRSSSRRRSSSSRDLKPAQHTSRSRSSSERRIRADQEKAFRSRSNSVHSRFRSTSMSRSSYQGSDGHHKKKRLVVLDSTDSDSEEEAARNNGSQSSIPEQRRNKWINIAFILGIIVAIVTTYLLMKGGSPEPEKSSDGNTIAEDGASDTYPLAEILQTRSPTIAPTGMPTAQYLPPDLEVCEALSKRQDVRTSVSSALLPRNMDINFEVTMRPGDLFNSNEDRLEFFFRKVESALIPILAGCDDVEGFQRKLRRDDAGPSTHDSFQRRGLNSLERIRYVIAGGSVIGTKSSTIECPTITSGGESLSCASAVVYFELLLKGDESVFDMVSLITMVLDQLRSQEEPVAPEGVNSPSLVKSFGLRDPPFLSVDFTGVKNNDPTVSPSVSPSEAPSNHPSISPSRGPTRVPSVPPTGIPSVVPSSNPSAPPTMSPTEGPTKPPTPEPTRLPTPPPTPPPTLLPSVSPSVVPSFEPSSSPSVVPSVSLAPSVSAAPSSTPSMSQAPSSRTGYIVGMLPATFDNQTVIDWLSDTDTWLPVAGGDEAALWAERYTMVLFSKNLTGLVQVGSPVCVWTGITCDANGRVAEVLLPSNGLHNGIPSELFALSELTKLDLSGNDYSGMSIPTELFGLTKMRHLDISHDGLIGTIPSEIVNAAALRELHINDNDLSGTIPELPSLVKRSPDDVITLSNGVRVSSVCEMYTNARLADTAGNAGGCDLVRTASDSSSSSSSSDDAPTVSQAPSPSSTLAPVVSSSATSAPVTRVRYRSLFRLRPLVSDDESSLSASDDEDDDDDEEGPTIRKQKKKRPGAPVTDFVGIHVPKAAKRKGLRAHDLVKKKMTKRGQKPNAARGGLYFDHDLESLGWSTYSEEE